MLALILTLIVTTVAIIQNNTGDNRNLNPAHNLSSRLKP